jgi:predicted AAA+ superfamily ATPase
MFKRLIINDLNKWASSHDHKPLVLRGARQVGKTTLVRNFAKEFDQFISLNLEKQEHKVLFESGYSFENLVAALFFTFGKRRNGGRTLIFIDEIQSSAEAIRQLRYFYEEAPDLYVIAAGSLLETLLNSGVSFPVGRVEYLAVRPCSFLEFLEANGETTSVEMIQKAEFPPFAHAKLLEWFHKYTLVGGMPEVVQRYSEQKDVVALAKTYQSLLAGYTDDVEKYAKNSSMIQHIRHILRSGFGFACDRIKFEKFANSDYRSREMGEAFRTLEKTMLLELVYPTVSRTLPLLANYKKSPRLLWLDTGLVNFAAGIQKEVFQAEDIQTAWKGKIAEHIVAQELLAYNTDVLYKRHFWTREEQNATAEIDFVIPFQGDLIPIEVKSGEKGTLKSLHLFMAEANHEMAIRISSRPFSIETIELPNKKYKLYNIPFYGISQIEKMGLLKS